MRWRKEKHVTVFALIVSWGGVFGHNLADDDLVVGAGENFAGVDRLDEFVGVGSRVEHSLPELGEADDRGGRGRIDGFGVGCDDYDHDVFSFFFFLYPRGGP